uniref:INSM transcriptional repressor 2 n=1 Tax=Oryzias sinensis TaxID=183150 RepID=A0A8C7XSV3_9TELE
MFFLNRKITKQLLLRELSLQTDALSICEGGGQMRSPLSYAPTPTPHFKGALEWAPYSCSARLLVPRVPHSDASRILGEKEPQRSGVLPRPFTQPCGLTDKYEISHMHVLPPLTLVTPEQQHAARKRSFLQEPHSKHHSKQGNPSKKPKINRKLNFEDEVTTSPVLGLRIKKESPEVRRQRETTSTPTAQPLGEFICQLCKEEYPDPFSLAQHKCSRIVRVEYRCPECDKVFSCPANLASHRRWHKPRPVISQGVEANRVSPLKETRGLLQQEEGKENELLLYECRYCGKKFRRQAYLKKHLVTHEMSRPTSSYNQKVNGSQSQQVFLCHLCGARFPSVEIRDKHRLWHQIFTCKYCPSTFFSSPGLTRHINKTHPTENRQVMRLQMTVRP